MKRRTFFGTVIAFITSCFCGGIPKRLVANKQHLPVVKFVRDDKGDLRIANLEELMQGVKFNQGDSCAWRRSQLVWIDEQNAVRQYWMANKYWGILSMANKYWGILSIEEQIFYLESSAFILLSTKFIATPDSKLVPPNVVNHHQYDKTYMDKMLQQAKRDTHGRDKLPGTD